MVLLMLAFAVDDTFRNRVMQQTSPETPGTVTSSLCQFPLRAAAAIVVVKEYSLCLAAVVT